MKILFSQACFQDWPGLQGRTATKFGIAHDGAVGYAATANSTMQNPALECCINTAVHGWRFPMTEGGGIVVVTYPFELEQAR